MAEIDSSDMVSQPLKLFINISIDYFWTLTCEELIVLSLEFTQLCWVIYKTVKVINKVKLSNMYTFFS